MNIQTFDYSVNLLRSILWQTNNAPRLQSLLQQKQAWYDANQTGFWTNWARDVFDLRTANAFGLAVWSIILKMPLQVTVGPIVKTSWGFGNKRKNFNNGTFARNESLTINLTLEQQRILLRLRYLSLVCRPTVPEINRIMATVLGTLGKVYVLDANDMSFATYVLGFAPDSQLKFVLENFDVLPRPAAVGVRYVISTRATFGFGSKRKNFGHGTFASA